MADECLEMALHCRVKNKYRHSILHGAITWRFVVFPATEKECNKFHHGAQVSPAGPADLLL